MGLFSCVLKNPKHYIYIYKKKYATILCHCIYINYICVKRGHCFVKQIKHRYIQFKYNFTGFDNLRVSVAAVTMLC